VHEGAEGLDRQDTAGAGLFAEHGAVGLEGGLPGDGGQLVKQVTVVAEEDAQALGDGPDKLAVRHVQADVVGEVHPEQDRAFLDATGADAALLAGEGDEELVAAIGAADAGEAVLEVAALEEAADGLVVDPAPVAELASVTLGIDGPELIEAFAQELMEVRFQRPPRSIDLADPFGRAGHRLSSFRGRGPPLGRRGAYVFALC
jgi:hypothetical protein